MDRQKMVYAVAQRFGFVQAWRSRWSRQAVPIRVLVIQSRGSAAVTRLISAGLNAGGLRTYAKTSGTAPRWLFADGQEVPVYRPRAANAREQRRAMEWAQREQAQAIVVEALTPATEQMVPSRAEWMELRPTHVVYVGARPATSEYEAMLKQMQTHAPQAQLFLLESHAGKDETATHIAAPTANARLVIDDDQIAAVGWDEMERFGHVEYREHVALALRVCQEFGVARGAALNGMWAAAPDPGVATVFHTRDARLGSAGQATFVNGFAVTDNVSLRRSWDTASGRFPHRRRLAIVNCRADRPDSWRPLAEAIVEWTPVDHFLVIGTAAQHFAQRLRALGIETDRVTCCSGGCVQRLAQTVRRLAGDTALVFGVGSMSGVTWELVDYFRKRTPAFRDQQGQRERRSRSAPAVVARHAA